MGWREDVERELDEDVYRLREAGVSGRVVVDLGANVGLFALRAVEAGAARVVCVEPHAAHFEELRARVGHLPGVELVRAAVGPSPGRGSMRGEDGSAVLVPGDDFDVLPLSALLPPGEVALLKLDVEGGEYGAILGCPSSDLARCVRISAETHATSPGSLGALVEKLTETHHVSTLGAASRGGYLWALRY